MTWASNVTTSPEPWSALVMSDNTRCFYTHGDVAPRYMAHVFGAFRAGIEARLPMTLIADWNLTPADLAPYKVLVLANTASLDDSQAAAIRSFVEKDGGLSSTLTTTQTQLRFMASLRTTYRSARRSFACTAFASSSAATTSRGRTWSP